MLGLKSLIGEVHRRSLWQVVGIYLGASWLVLQVVETLSETSGLPDWVGPGAIVLLLIGFPIVLTTAFIQEGMRSRADQAAAPSQHPEELDVAATADADVTPAARAEVPKLEEGSEPAVSDPSSTGHRLFTWRNALLGGAAAFTLLGIVTAAWMIMRAAGIGPAATLVARGVIDARDRVILAEFENRTGDSLLAQVVTEAFRVDLAQSPLVTVVEPSYVSGVLSRMARDSETPLDLELAREVALRDGIKAIVAGDIGTAGTGYVLSVRLEAADGGEVLASHRAAASDSTEIIDAIDDASRKLREQIGESLRAVRAEEPLAQVTTSALEALRMYSQAIRAIEVESRPEKGIALLEEAVALDSAFAMAWRKLGVVLRNRGQERSRAMAALRKAYENRDRLSRRERLLTTSTYYFNVTDENEKAIAALENLVDVDPSDSWALNNLSVLWGRLEEHARAEEYARRAIQADSTNPIHYGNAVDSQLYQEKFEGAEATVAAMARRIPETPRHLEWGAYVASATHDYTAAADLLRELRQREARSLFWRAFTNDLLGSLFANSGRLTEAQERYADAIETNEERDLPDQYLQSTLNLARLQARFDDDPSEALETLIRAFEQIPFSDLDPLDRPYVDAVRFYTEVGRIDRAKEFLADFEASEASSIGNAESSLRWMSGSVALAEGRYEDAIDELSRIREYYCRTCGLPELARAYDLSGQADSSLAVYERFVAPGSAFRIFTDQGELGPAYERLGQLYDQGGDYERAAEYYAKFVELWKEADPELQPRVEAAQTRLDAIFAERG